MFVSVEPANICQLRCPECPVGQRANSANAQHFMSMPVWQRVIEQVAPYAYTMQFYFQGEPLLHNDLPQMIAQAHGKGEIVTELVKTLYESMDEEAVEEVRELIYSASYSAEKHGFYLGIHTAIKFITEAMNILDETHEQ